MYKLHNPFFFKKASTLSYGKSFNPTTCAVTFFAVPLWGGFFIYIKNDISPFDNPPMYYYSYGYENPNTNSYTDTNYRDGGYMAIKKY